MPVRPAGQSRPTTQTQAASGLGRGRCDRDWQAQVEQAGTAAGRETKLTLAGGFVSAFRVTRATVPVPLVQVTRTA